MAGYHVSGEFAMIKAAAANGWIDEKKATLEALLSIKRVGADFIVNYHCKDVARWLSE
jgi:porphobilinogen synthase